MITFTRCAFMAKQACATFSKVVQKITPPIANNFLKFFFALFAILTLNAATAWAESETMATWTFSSSSYPSNKTNYEATSGTCKTGSTFYLNGTGSTWNTSKGYAFTAITDITITVKLSKAISAGTPLTFSADMFYNKDSNAPMKGFNLSVSENGSAYSTTGLSVTSISLGTSSANKVVKYTTQNALAKDATIQLKYTGTGKAGSGQGYFGNIKVIAEIAVASCDKKVTLTKGPETNGTFTLDKANGSYDNCDEDFVVKVSNVVPKLSSQYCSGVDVTGGNSTVTGPVEGVWTVTYANGNNITSTITPIFVDKTSAKITLSEAGQEKTVEDKYVGDSYELPLTSTQTCGTKTFVGWSTVTIDKSSTKPTTNFYEPGASVTLADSQTFYAVFAEGDGLSDEDEALLSYEGGTSNDLKNTEGLSANGQGSDYAESHTYYRVKLDDTGDYILYHNESKPYISKVIFKVKMIGGATTSTMTVKTSDDGDNYTTMSECSISGSQNAVITSTATVNTNAKYLQFYFTKGSNVGFGPLFIYTKSTSYQNYTTKCAQTYTVTFNANGHGTAPTTQNVEENGKASKPTDPSAAGYTFGGWYKEAECTNAWDFENDEVTGDITLYAKWTAETYTITLDANGGKFVQDGTESTTIEIKYTHGTYASYDAAQLISEYLEEKGITLSREGYQLNEMWQSNGSSWKRVFTAINRTITAQWSKLYTITLSENGKETTPTTQTATSYTLPTELPAGTCQDDTKEFVGWTTNQDLSSETTPTSDFYKKGETVTLSEDKTTFYAVFATPKTNPGEMVEEEVTAAVNISSYATANGWTNGEQYKTVNIDDNITAIASGTTFTGCYYTNGTNWRLYYSEDATLTIGAKDGITINSLKITYISEKNGVLLNNGEQISSGKECFVNAESVQFKTGLSSGTESGQVRITKMEVTYTTTVQADDIVTYSNYSTKCVPTWKITYNFDGGDGECTTAIVEEGSEYTLCATIPTKAGHTFLNWKDQDGTKYEAGDKISSVTKNLTLTAQWQVNSYEVTWMSLGSKLPSSDVNYNYNTQPTQPTTNPTYLCGTDKEFVGWTTQEIEGVGTPANLYTNDFPAVTADVTYHAVFATKSEDGGSLAKATSLTSGETVYLATESGIGVMGANTETNKDAAVSTTQSDWMAFTVVANGEQYQFKNGENYISAAAKSFKITATPSDFTFENSYIVYNVSTVSDAGNYVLLYNSNSGSFYRFYKISNMGKENYETFYIYKSNPTHTDYVTSCEEVGSDMSNSTKVITPSVESGIFSVGDGKYVQFSTGNLQYEVGTNTWSFASEQYEVIGGAAYDPANPTNTNYGMNEPGYTGKLDLFAWSSDGKFGVNPSNTDDDYVATDFEDWGELVNETGWYTLTKDEMNYILNRKKDGKKLWALATVCGMNGLILLPDNWNTSTTLEYGYIPADWNYTKNQLDDAAWAALEAGGAVFLPEGGSRVGGHGNKDNAGGAGTFDANGDYFHVDNVNIYGYYWLNTQDPRDTHKNCASFLILPGWSEGPTNADEDDICLQPQVWSREKRRGNSVRLVKAIEPTYTRNGQTSGAYGTVCYPENIVWCEGATLYKVAGKEGNKVIFDEVTTPEAGMPYIFIAEQEKLNFFCGDEKEIEAGKHNSLQGTFTQIDPAVDNILVDNYMLVNNIIKKCGINCGLYANRAYFVADDLENMDKAPAAAPGRRRISLDVTSENTTTGLDNITNGENTTIKAIENGQLIIIRNGEKFNAQGQKL